LFALSFNAFCKTFFGGILFSLLSIAQSSSQAIELIYVWSESMIVSVNTLSDIEAAAQDLKIPLQKIQDGLPLSQLSAVNRLKEFLPFIHFPILYVIKNGKIVYAHPGAETSKSYKTLIRPWLAP